MGVCMYYSREKRKNSLDGNAVSPRRQTSAYGASNSCLRTDMNAARSALSLILPTYFLTI